MADQDMKDDTTTEDLNKDMDESSSEGSLGGEAGDKREATPDQKKETTDDMTD